MLTEIKRSELANMAKLNKVDINEYISQVVREYPELDIINDSKQELSKEEKRELAKRRASLGVYRKKMKRISKERSRKRKERLAKQKEENVRSRS